MEARRRIREQWGRFRERQAVRLGFRWTRAFGFQLNRFCVEQPELSHRIGQGLCFRGASPPGQGMGPVKHASGVRLLGKITWLCVSGISPSVLMCLASFPTLG